MLAEIGDFSARVLLNAQESLPPRTRKGSLLSFLLTKRFDWTHISHNTENTAFGVQRTPQTVNSHSKAGSLRIF
ncbi:MAG: hypothetical protein AAFY73_06870 [Pseudomonadota bacterium]